MKEQFSPQERCDQCPNRSKIVQALARIVGSAEIAESCEGPIKVAHGTIVTQVRTARQPAPPQRTWNSVTSEGRSGGVRRYSRTDWEYEDVCGKESLQPGEGEVPYVQGETVRTNTKGKRMAAFIAGTNTQIAEHRSSQAVMSLLDSLDTPM